ncbi:MAG: hypothetical protein L0332_22995 [Chloroflexi bacterium]|nr:hypothetical protein [Chloroflexota bacterium]MCI0578220.1 hypothetical protein [Chloroflexota bacterium]MCI0645287.1 hypothetical protein [Chloroflexota bacterium]MCI0729559.1 hypothetical protein [Chloroflexota bacterium]
MNPRHVGLDQPAAPYQAYLLRLWQEAPHQPWRAYLQHATSGERHVFPDLEALFAFLIQVTAEQQLKATSDE